MSLILNLETSTEICSVAISRGKEVIALKESAEAYSHSSQITLLIEACMEEANVALKDIDAIALSEGPGSYTALRVGASTAKGIGYALGKPLIAINTLQALARASVQADVANAIYAPMIDARRMEVYTQLFDADFRPVAEMEAKIIDENAFSSFFEKNQHIVFSGNGAPKCSTVITNPLAHFLSLGCSATHLVPLAVEALENKDFTDLAYFSPNYFKSPNITKPKQIW